MPPTAQKPDPNLKNDPDREDEDEAEAIQGPPEEEFWERYNNRLEFPLASVGSVFVHILVFGILVFGLFYLLNDADQTNPPLQLVQVGGLDDTGEGSAGSGGQEDPDLERNVDPLKAAATTFATPQQLEDAKENIRKVILDDANGNLPIAPSNAAALSQLNEALAKKLMGVELVRGKETSPAGVSMARRGADRAAPARIPREHAGCGGCCASASRAAATTSINFTPWGPRSSCHFRRTTRSASSFATSVTQARWSPATPT